MKYLIVGLGNPGAEYADNRHNIGFMVVDQLAGEREARFAQDRHGYTCTIRIKGRQITLLKPTTYMNLSGKAVRYHLQILGIPPDNLLVITDDIALPFGKLRLRGKGSHGGHNGLRNIEEVLGQNKYPRLRFGVGDDFARGAQAHYVLSDFNAEEIPDLPAKIEAMTKAVVAFVTIGLSRTMNEVNQKKKPKAPPKPATPEAPDPSPNGEKSGG
ncbi:MAG: aminoacyl-tRNA hydrolase [Bacteroidota bacterium]